VGFLSAEAEKPTEVSVGFRRGWFRHIRIALAPAAWLAVIVTSIKLLAERPREGFGLLARWGPWPFLGFLGLCIAAHFLSGLGDTIRMAFRSMVESFQQGAQAQTRTADALTLLAEQGGRQGEEVRRLAIYAAQEFPGVYGRLDRQDETLGNIAAVVQEIRAHQQRESRA
jgi:hypothetical protein